MKHKLTTRNCKLLSSFVLALPLTMLGQAPPEYPYQVNYASNLNLGDSVVNIVNSGTSAGSNIPIVGGNTYGDICANIYIYAPDQELAACCTCLASPNSLHSWPISFGPGNLLENVIPGSGVAVSINATHSVVIKLLATAATGAGAGLSSSCPRPDAPNGVVPGMAAWATHAHPTNTATVAITETLFAPASVTSGELGKLTNDCNYSIGRGVSFVCTGCRLGGLATPSF